MTILGEALVAVQRALPDVRPDAVNPHFRNEYVSLDALLRAVRPVLNEHGVVLIQAPCVLDGQPALRTVLLHGESGEQFETTMLLLHAKADPQAQGSALTYARRYALTALLGVAEADDDANTASTGGAARAATRGASRAPAAPAPDKPHSPADTPGPSPPASSADAAAKAQADTLTRRVLELAEQLGLTDYHRNIADHRRDHDLVDHIAWLNENVVRAERQVEQQQATFVPPSGRRGAKAKA